MKNLYPALFLAVMLVAVSVGVSRVSAQAAPPVITSLSHEIGPIGNIYLIQGSGFTASNTVDFGFGQVHDVAPTGPTSSTLGFRLACPEDDDTCGPTPAQGYIDVTVINENGTSNALQFLVAPHAGGCYEVDDFEEPQTITPVACDSPRCNAGACEEPEPSPTPVPSPSVVPTATPLPSPSPTPGVDIEDDDADGGVAGAKSGSSASGSTGRVAGASTGQGPSAADRAAADFIPNNQVVLTVEKLYRQVYGKPTTICTSHYWKIRARSNKPTQSKLLGAMSWQRAHGRDPIYRSCYDKHVAGATKAASASGGAITHKDINRLYRQIHNGQNPTPAVNRYWLSRLKDKPTTAAMLGAMQWHKVNGTGW